MIYQREYGSCSGRGFSNASATGFLARFKAWIAQAYPNGPGWTIIDDQSQDPGYGKWGKVTSDYVAGSFDTLAEVQAITNGSFRLTIGTTTANVTGINFSSVVTWDDVASTIQTAIRAASGAAEFTNAVCGQYQYRSVQYGGDSLGRKFVIVAGTRGLDVGYLTTATASVGTDISGTNYLRMVSGQGILESGTLYPSICVCSSSTPSWNDDPPNKYIHIGQDSGTGYVYISVFLNWDTTLHQGYCLWSHNHLTTEDAGPFVYDFRGGDEIMVIQSFRLGVWYSFILDQWVGDTILVEDTTVKGITTSAVTTSNSSVTLSTGQGSLFTAGNFYYLIDLNKSESIQYLQIAPGGITGDTITFTGNFNMPAGAGAILTPYFHRFYNVSSGYQAYIRSRIPYISIPKKEQRFQGGYQYDIGCSGTVLSEYLVKMNPNDMGNYACMKTCLAEAVSDGAVGSPNRAYGTCKNTYTVFTGTMNAGTDGKIVNGKNFLYFQSHSDMFQGGDYRLCVLVPDYNENI